MSELLFGALESLFNIVFVVFLLVAVFKYRVFESLPVWIQLTIFWSLGLSGVFGLLALY